MLITVLILCFCIILQTEADSPGKQEKRYSPTKDFNEGRPAENEKVMREFGNRLSIIEAKIENLQTACSCCKTTPTKPATTTASNVRPRDCSDIKKAGETRTGVYTIYPDGIAAAGINVSCDLTNEGGGWTVFQRRQDGSVDFYRGWEEYRRGFGKASGEFWLGNDNIHHLTVQRVYKLRVVIKDWSGSLRFAEYNTFYIDAAKSKYKLHVGGYSGDAGDSLTYHNNQYFTTKDRDNDSRSRNPYPNCAMGYKGGWWYKDCYYANLNGVYYKSAVDYGNSVSWYHYKKKSESLKFVEMKIRPLHFGQ